MNIMIALTTKLSDNGFGLDAGREIEVRMFNYLQMPNRSRIVQNRTEALLAFKPMLVAWLGFKEQFLNL